MNLNWAYVLMAPLLTGLAGLALLSIYYALQRATRRGHKRRARLYRCTVCGHVHEDTRNVPLSSCPRCGRLNEAVRH